MECIETSLMRAVTARVALSRALERRVEGAFVRPSSRGARGRVGKRSKLATRQSLGGGGDMSRKADDASRVTVRSIETATETQRKDVHVVLVTPKIPGNTGCIARTCAAARVPLHLVGPLGFSLDDAQLKRAGLDYWKSVCVRVHDDWEAFYAYWRGLERPGRLVAFSKFGARPHAEEGAYAPGDWLLFGAETTGLPDAAMEACKATGGVRRIPIDETHVRSLNLSVSAGIGVYEALRQLDGSPTGE